MSDNSVVLRARPLFLQDVHSRSCIEKELKGLKNPPSYPLQDIEKTEGKWQTDGCETIG